MRDFLKKQIYILVSHIIIYKIIINITIKTFELTYLKSKVSSCDF